MSLPDIYGTRKIIQIAADEGSVMALCDDGSVWVYYSALQSWMRIDTTTVEQVTPQ